MICSDRSIRSTMQNVQRLLRMDHTPGAGNWITVITKRSIWTHFDWLRTKLLLKTFYDFLIRHFKKNVKSHVFWNLKKKHKIRILEHCSTPRICAPPWRLTEKLSWVLMLSVRQRKSRIWSAAVFATYSDTDRCKEAFPSNFFRKCLRY